jgi:DNA-binding CsgD family transcriptional regulator
MTSLTMTKVGQHRDMRLQDRTQDATNGGSPAGYEDADGVAAKHTGPGILILSTSGRFLYKDRRAWELCSQLPASVGGDHGTLPEVIEEMCAQITKLLQVWTHTKDWEEYRVKRYVGEADRGMLLSGLGLPDRYGLQEARILITIEEIGPRYESGLGQAKEMFQLTPREMNVIENLLKGWTNKEIGNALGVSEQTVKEHIKHIMAKTKTTTRTGILVRVMGV